MLGSQHRILSRLRTPRSSGVCGETIHKMSSNDSQTASTGSSSRAGSSFLGSAGEWMTSGDHKRIGRLFVGAALLFAVAAGVVGVLVGLERMTPTGLQIVAGDAVLQLTSVYEFGLTYAVLVPLLLGIAVAVVPLQVGSRAIALPRVAQAGFWMWLFGTLVVVISIIGNGGPGGGQLDLVDMYLLGLALTLTGLMAASLSVAVTVLTSRAPGMSIEFIPPFSWSALVGSVSMLLALPVAIGTIAYLYVDHTYGQQALGGNKGIDANLGWAMSAPMTVLFVIMALGVLAEIAPVAGGRRHPNRPLVFVGAGLLSTAVLGAVTQSTHVLEWTGSTGDKVSSAIPFLFFNGLPLLGALVYIVAAVMAFKDGRPRISASMVNATAGSLLVLAGVAGHFFASISSTELIGTSFEEGVLLYLVLGGLLTGLAALAHWSPKLWGVVLDERTVGGLGALALLGSILAALPLYVAGLAGQPLGSVFDFDYSGPIALWNGLNAAGLVMVVLTVVAFSGALASAVRSGAVAADDPWDGQTLEWAVPSPASTNNFEELVTVSSGEPVLDAKSPQEVSS